MAVCGVASRRRRLRRFHPISSWELDRHTPCLSALWRCPERIFRQKKAKNRPNLRHQGRGPCPLHRPKIPRKGPMRIESTAVKSFHVARIGKWRLAALVLSAGAFVFLSGVQSWPDQLHGMRPVNRQDELYRYVAQELDEPALCDEIPWSAESPGGFFIAPSYQRSNCYAFIAGRTKNPRLCWQVKRLGAFRLLSQQLSMWSCLADARRGMNAGIGVNPDELATF